METKIQLGDITVDVVQKDIKNIHLSVYPPTGRVRISAPSRMDIETIRVFAISKLDWIKKNQKKLQGQTRETPREYLDRESHYLWGKRFLLNVIKANQSPSVELAHNKIILTVRPRTDKLKKHSIVEAWYRNQIREAAQPLIAKWEQKLGVKVERVYVRRMKTKWGSCNYTKRSIRLNTELAKKTLDNLEYIIVHEMIHLLEPSHNKIFKTLINQYMPQWKQLRDDLNQAPIGYVNWG